MKMLKSKNIRRICVLFAMLAPVVYLFGSLFAGLTGAHGQQVFADEVSGEGSSFVEVGNTDYVGSYRFVFDDDAPSPSNYLNVMFPFTCDTASFKGVSLYPSKEIYYLTAVVGGSDWLIRNSSGVWPVSSRLTISFYLSAPNRNIELLLPYGTLYFDEAFDPATQYSDYVFGQFFDKDNFLEQIGKDVLSESPHGFVPFASFWKYLDENMLHMGNLQLGLMGYGYVYYCCHVLLFDIAFILVTFFLDFIQKVNDKVVGGVD